MPRFKSDLHDWPSLNRWLYTIGLTDSDIKKYFYYSALVDYFPGAKNGTHLVPTSQQISQEFPRLQKTLYDFDPEIVVPVGVLSTAYCLDRRPEPLTSTIGQTFTVNPYGLLGKVVPVIPLPHPSGASTWHHKPDNKLLLSKSLTLLKNYLISAL